MEHSCGLECVTFAMEQDAKTVLSSEHMLGNRMLEVKVATPKEEMRRSMKKVTRIFVARIPPSVMESAFRRIMPPKHIEELASSHLPVQWGGGRPSRADKRFQPY